MEILKNKIKAIWHLIKADNYILATTTKWPNLNFDYLGEEEKIGKIMDHIHVINRPLFNAQKEG